MESKRLLIGEYLVKNGVITQEQLDQAILLSQRTKEKIGDTIIKLGFVEESKLFMCLAEQLDIAYVDITSYQIDAGCLKLLSKKDILRLQAVPLYRISHSLTVAMTDPLNVDDIDELEHLTGYTINPIFTTSSGIKAVVAAHFDRDKPLPEVIPAIIENGKDSSDKEDDVPSLIKEATKEPVIKLVQKVFQEAVKCRASDIHIEPQEKGFMCRYRVDGVLQKPQVLDNNLRLAVISRIKIMANIDIAEKRLPQDGRLKMKIGSTEVDLRVATFPTLYGEHVAVRLLDKSRGVLNFKELGLRDYSLTTLSSVIKKPHGLVLVTGPTGSGKTTTLYSILHSIKDLSKNIITLEDPIEYSIENINQSQVNVKAGLTFAIGLRSMVRLDPDIIMIGEIRDKETAEIAIHAALTGHLVFSTLHTNNAPSACTRLMDMGVEPYLLASSLKAVLAQRLVRTLCASCKKEYKVKDEEKSLLELNAIKYKDGSHFYEAGGCKNCQQIGYQGRTGIFELFTLTDKMQDLILNKAPAFELLEESKKNGMKTLFEEGLALAAMGVTSLSEVLRVTEEF